MGQAEQDDELRALVEKFVSDLEGLMAKRASTQAKAFQAKLAGLLAGEVDLPAVAEASVSSASKKRGRPPGSKNKGAGSKKALAGQRQVQTCPVPGCKNPAAPVFGMVCEKHKAVPKAKITLFRKQRKFAKKNNLSLKHVSENWAKYRLKAA